MKIRLSIITENNKSVEVLGEDAEAKIRDAWNIVLLSLSIMSPNKDKAYVENVEILEG